MGDIDTTSINYLKSVVFQGNEDAYYLTENVFAFASSAFIPISQAAKVGNLTFCSGAATVAKEGIAMMAGAGASDITMKISGNQTASVVAGMIAGGVAGHGLNSVDAKFNVSGNGGKSGSDTVAYHSVGGDNSAKKIQSVLDGIDISYTSPESRFGQGFYVAADGNTTVAELAYHGTDAKYSIRYDMNLDGQKVLDLTDSIIANEWGFSQGKSSLLECQNIAEMALDEGYNVIKVPSYRKSGINYVIYDSFDEILQPQMVTPIGE